MTEPIRMSDGKYPISDQHSAKSAWDLRNNSTTHSEAEVVAHIRKACAALGLHFPGDRQTAAVDMSARSHGFVFPGGLPDCSTCNLPANDPTHVNPAKGGVNLFMGSALGGTRIVSAQGSPSDTYAVKRHRAMGAVRRSHAYASGSTAFGNLMCTACGQPMGASCHTAGMPAGMNATAPGPSMTYGGVQTAAEGDLVQTHPGVGPSGYGEIVLVRHEFVPLEGEQGIDPDYKLCALCGYAADDEVHPNGDQDSGDDKDNEPNKVVVKQLARVTERIDDGANERSQGLPASRQQAFVTQLNGKLLITGPAQTFTEPDDGMPRELAAAWEKASAQNPHFLWLEGRFVEANRPNRNRAAWSSEDLEMGEPTVAHGPLNWLHEERHIIGAIAAAKLITVSDADRQAAASMGRDPVNNHIRTLSPVWRYLYPTESRQIARASDERKLWYSMECTSREVACLAPGCAHVQPYGEYMLQPYTRCNHVKAGGDRRFADPTFLGGAVIIPPVRPGWGGANATVMRQAAMLAERQEAAFDGLTTSEAEMMVAQIISYAGRQ